MTTKVELLRRALIGFYSLLACYCLAIAQLVFHRPCAPPLPLSASDACSNSDLMATTASASSLSLERVVLFFHLAAALAWVLSASVTFIGITRLQFVARWLAAAFAGCYAAFGVYELAVARASSSNAVVAALCLLLSVCTTAFGVTCSVAYERELRRQRSVAPEASFSAVVTQFGGDSDANGAARPAW